MKPSELISLFDEFLLERNLRLEAVLIGGAALALQGVTARETRDCDIIEPELPAAIVEAARAFAAMRSVKGEVLREDWLNNGPSQLGRILPEELSVAAAWIVQQDANLDWPAHVETTQLDLARRCGHGL